MKTWHVAEGKGSDHFALESGPERIFLKGKLLPASECEHGVTYWKVSQSDCYITLQNGEQKIDLKGKLVRVRTRNAALEESYKNEKTVAYQG